MNNHYDAIIIGAGMSGLAAGIRLAMFDKKVVILEKHSISGGLNSYYQRRIAQTKEIIELDVGLHALTNFATKGQRGKPLTKLLKQLRIPYEALSLEEQTYSLIQFESETLKFSNDFELLRSEISLKFPKEKDSFEKFVAYLNEYNEVSLQAKYVSARAVLNKYFNNELLEEMLMAPLLIYGSAWENDMDFSQFVIMFKSLYFEGFSRPKGGVRTVLNLLLDKYKSLGGEIRFRSPVESIQVKDAVQGVYLKNGEFLEAKKIFSSAGLPETFSMVNKKTQFLPQVGKLSFTETILVYEDKSILKDFDPTIVFYNSSDKYLYQKPKNLFDSSSAVFCLPDNYNRQNDQGHAMARITYMANYDLWKAMERKSYLLQKEEVFKEAKKLSEKLIKPNSEPLFKDVFTPTTIERYTNHFDGTVYGSTTKLRDGKTEIEGLHIIGTDQGFLGIVGSMLSGISMANLYGLMES
ncbi:MAG: FAD-dependent oxidoreductase [Bacteriovoracaceae bacterium]|jgi:phytoene dehydrogenase-like protein|nr:FAD-dependent oxidoreductase [Bacteriovoracaceae bacterium]